MDYLRSQSARAALSLGLLSGIFILFTGAVGMIAAFHERDVINDFISLGQLLLILTPFAAGYVAANRLGAFGESHNILLGSGLVIGLLTVIPTVILLLFNSDEFRFLLAITLRLVPFVVAGVVAWRIYQTSGDGRRAIGIGLAIALLTAVVTYSLALIFDISGDLRSVLVNINRDWVEVITFDNQNDLLAGIGAFSFVSDYIRLGRRHFDVDPACAAPVADLRIVGDAIGGRFWGDGSAGLAGEP